MIINEINIERYDNNKHREYIEKCINSPDYKFININKDKLNYCDMYVFSRQKRNIGFLIPNISNITYVSVSNPIIFITEKRTLDSVLMIFNLLEFIFNYLNVEVIHMPVYSDNKRMINLMKNNNIEFIGTQKNYKDTNILYYILSKEDYLKMYSSGKYRYG